MSTVFAGVSVVFMLLAVAVSRSKYDYDPSVVLAYSIGAVICAVLSYVVE